MNDQTRAVLDAFINPECKDFMDLANVPGVGVDLVLLHIELMRSNNENLPTALIALEKVLKRK